MTNFHENQFPEQFSVVTKNGKVLNLRNVTRNKNGVLQAYLSHRGAYYADFEIEEMLNCGEWQIKESV